jgi:hypothetical protein
MMRRPRSPLTYSLLALALVARRASAQDAVPVVTLPEPSARVAETLGVIIGVRELADGRLLVDDAGRRQIKLFDAALASATVVLDSTPGTSKSYGARPVPLVRYLGDSTLVPNYASRTMSVIDPSGRVARSLAMPSSADVGLVRRGASIDASGRLLYVGNAPLVPPPAARAGQKPLPADSTPILRADFDLRRTDTIARIARPLERTGAVSPDGATTLNVFTPNPLRAMDEWAVLSDGSVAIVRGHDYHIDWIRPDGSRASGGKLPFDWKQLRDDDKQRIIDSTRARLNAAIESGTIMDQAEQVTIERAPRPPDAPALPPAAPARGGGRGGGFFGFTLQPRDSTSLDQVADYYPPLRPGAAMADLDGHLWILPTTSKQSKRGELVYDVTNANGELSERVRLPLGRLIVGFGRGGVVYLMSGDRASGFSLERTRLPASSSPR